MDLILNNRIADILFYNEASVVGTIVFLILVIVLIVFYKELYSNDNKETHITKFIKAGALGFITTYGLIYLSKHKSNVVSTHSGYDDIKDFNLDGY